MYIKKLYFALLLVPAFNSNALPILAGDDHLYHNGAPFGEWSNTTRYQQIYISSIFSSSGYLESMAFAPIRDGYFSADITIKLSYSDKSIGNLSTDLESNILTGSQAVVFSQSGFYQDVTGGTENFSLLFDFGHNDFFYDPTMGNLLLDIAISNVDQNGISAVSADRTDTYTSRSYTRLDSPPLADEIGLRTMFELTPTQVPEPATFWLFGLSMLGLFGFKRKLC